MAKAQNYVGEGGTPHRMYPRRGGQCTYYLDRGTIFDHMFIMGWGHHTKFQTLAVGRVAGWVVGIR